MSDKVDEARSGVDPSNIQEMLDAGVSAGETLMKGQGQYETPIDFARYQMGLLPTNWPWVVFDPQVAAGNLVNGFSYRTSRIGFELDNRYRKADDGVIRVIGNCVKAWEALDDMYPDLKFDCQVANPPFGLRWFTADGEGKVDSVEFTWKKMMERVPAGGCGYFLAPRKAIEEAGIHEQRWVYLYQTFPSGVFNANVEIAVVHFWASDDRPARFEVHNTKPDEWKCRDFKALKLHFKNHPWENSDDISAPAINAAFAKIQAALNEERTKRPPFNIWIDANGILKTYLSTRFQVKRKLRHEEIIKVSRINNSHPLTLSVDKETRVLLAELVSCGVYSVQPEAAAAILDAIKQVTASSCPIMPVTDFETVAYADEEDHLVCKKTKMGFTKGRKYPLRTETYKFTEKFIRRKPHLDESAGKMYIAEHDCELSGTDRCVIIKNDSGEVYRFMDRPGDKNPRDCDEKILWDIFEKPIVKTVDDLFPEVVERNTQRLKTLELLADFTYYPGQVNYLARVGTKDYALIGGATGTGKSLMALSLIQLKSPKRALIIAPQGTLRAEEDSEDEVEFQVSQWVAEIRKFSPGRAVFELFSMDDYERVLRLNGGELPAGIYITYYQAFFSNGGREKAPDTWDDERLAKELNNTWLGGTAYKLPPAPKNAANEKKYWAETVGREVNGIRCIIAPCMATQIGHNFDMVCVDEAHVAANLGANLTQMLIRLQPKYRFLFTATPIPNIVINLFSLMGWLCVPDWYKGKILNPAWPYAREDGSKFASTFLSMERDLTQEDMNDEAAKKKTGKVTKASPIISSPARLLKILKPTMAYISKQDCKPGLPPAKVVDVRVPFGAEQMKLYSYFLNRANIPSKNALVRARMQLSYLRYICADPAGFTHGGPKVTSNFNPKTIAVMELVREILAKGDQVTIISARIGQTSTYVRMLTEAGVKVSRIDSTVGADKHSYESNAFKRGQTQVCVMGIKCASSHSFQQCPYLIIGSLEYSNGPYDQACGRIDRVNSPKQPTVYCVLHKFSYEETMFDTVATKDDSAKICLMGKRVPRLFKPVDLSEVLADSMAKFEQGGQVGVPEMDCHEQWPDIRSAIRKVV